jgi:hypothetical protein
MSSYFLFSTMTDVKRVKTEKKTSFGNAGAGGVAQVVRAPA